MNKNRLIYIAVAIALLMTGGFTFNAAIGTASIMSDISAATQWIEANQSALNPADASLGAASQSSPDPYLSPDNFIVVPNGQSAIGTTGADSSDYFARHRDSVNAVAVGASDWFQRHPELFESNRVPDLSDYSLRHPSSANDTPSTDDECTLIYPDPCQ